MKSGSVLSAISIIIVALGLAPALWPMTRPASATADQDLGPIVADALKSNPQIKNGLVYAAKGDGSFTGSGVAGIAEQEAQLPMTKDTPIYLASITKLYTAVVIMRLSELGALALDDPMAKYLPEDLIRGIHVYQGHDYSREITVEQLLDQTSGIADFYGDRSKDGLSLFEIFVADPGRTWTVEETIGRARNDLAPHFRPGTAVSYSDTNYQLLGKIIESVTGKPLQAAYEEIIFRPLGLSRTWLIGRSKPRNPPSAGIADVFSKDLNITRIRSNGSYWAEGGMVSTAEDAIVFLKALNQGRMIRQDTLELMHRTWRRLPNMPIQYGYGTMRIDFAVFGNPPGVSPVWGHSGSVGSFLYYSPGLDLYMAGTIDQTEDRITPIRLMIKMMQAIGGRTNRPSCDPAAPLRPETGFDLAAGLISFPASARWPRPSP
jgi:D-alanyl-D-alanine carboxypeptidase